MASDAVRRENQTTLNFSYHRGEHLIAHTVEHTDLIHTHCLRYTLSRISRVVHGPKKQTSVLPAWLSGDLYDCGEAQSSAEVRV